MKAVIFMYSSVFVVSLSETLLFVAPLVFPANSAPANVLPRNIRSVVVSGQETATFCQFSHHRPVVTATGSQADQHLLSHAGRGVLHLQQDEGGEVAEVENKPSSIRSLFSPCLLQERADAQEEGLRARLLAHFFLIWSSYEKSSGLLPSLCTDVRVQHDRIFMLGFGGRPAGDSHAAVAERVERVRDLFGRYHQSHTRGGFHVAARAHD